MLIVDTPAQARAARSEAGESTLAQREQALAQEIASNTISVNIEDGWDCASFEQRVGKPLTTEEVKRRLALCNPGLIFERSINFPDLTGVYFEKDERTAAGTWTKRKVFLFTMSSGEVMPEREIAHVAMKKVPNPDFIKASGGQKVDRDVVKWIEVPTVYDLTRGWRTVLIRLLRAQLVTRGDVEKHFEWTPSVDSPNWAMHTR